METLEYYADIIQLAWTPYDLIQGLCGLHALVWIPYNVGMTSIILHAGFINTLKRRKKGPFGKANSKGQPLGFSLTKFIKESKDWRSIIGITPTTAGDELPMELHFGWLGAAPLAIFWRSSLVHHYSFKGSLFYGVHWVFISFYCWTPTYIKLNPQVHWMFVNLGVNMMMLDAWSFYFLM